MPVTGLNKEVMELLDLHHESFFKVLPLARKTGHTVPSDTKSWSEILVSLITEISGRNRKKGTDLDDGSDVKAANLWEAIDTPRFNGGANEQVFSEASRCYSARRHPLHLFRPLGSRAIKRLAQV
jgi:hypothetical protein